MYLERAGQQWSARYPWRLYRVLFDDGTVAEVWAARDDSDLRAAIIEAEKRARIVGMAEVTDGDGPDAEAVPQGDAGGA